MKGIRQQLYPAMIAVLVVALGAALLSRWQVSIETEPTNTDTPPTATSPPSPSPLRSPTPAPTPVAPIATPSPTPTAVPSTAADVRSGSLRVSNRTSHAIRVALLAANSTRYKEPVHWDFAPQEGGDRGLRLSLPEGNLQVREGDVIVAFAEDGSRRYWGPFVIGKTALPVWNADSQEWQMILQPE